MNLQELEKGWKRMELKINLNNNSYSIFIEKGILNNAVDYINKVYKNKKIYIITDDNVSKLYLSSLINNLKANYDVDYVVFPHGEDSKNINTYAFLWIYILWS